MSFAVACVQFSPRLAQAQQNRERTVRLVETAAQQGARLVVLPELAVPGYTTDGPILAEAAEPIDGATFAAWSDAARRLGVLIAGGFCERAGEHLYNAAMLVGPDGLLLHYRKLHLFDREKLVFAPGDRGLDVVDTPCGRIGLCVCYDLRFVEVMRALALQGADIAAVPTAWVGGFDRRAADADPIIGQARGAMVQANLNQIYVACASQCGEAGGTRFLGSSLIVDPYGQPLAGPLDDREEAIAVASVDPEHVRASQERSALVRPRQDRRTDVYGLALGGLIF